MRITDTLSIDESEIEERFLRASGPGGQHVNKTESAVQLRFDVARSSLEPGVKQRLVGLAGLRRHCFFRPSMASWVAASMKSPGAPQCLQC